MPSVVDTSTGDAVDVAPDAIADAWKANKIQPIVGAKYHVQAPDGSFHEVPGERLHIAIKNRGRIISEADYAAHQTEEEYGGFKGGAIAFGGGALEQGTLGIGSSLLPDSAKSAIKKSTGLHPYAEMAGQVAGGIGLAAATGGLGEAAGLGELAAGGVGGLAERGAASLIGEGAETVLGKIATRGAVQAARGVAEGAQFGVAREISQHAIAPEDHPLTAASILANVGGDALWGGALGGGLGLLGGAASHLLGAGEGGHVPKLDKILEDGRSPAPSDVASVAGKAIGVEEPAAGLGAAVKKSMTKLVSMASGAKEEDLAPFWGKEARQVLDEAESTRDEASRAIRGHVDEVLKSGREVQEEATGSLKRGYIRKAIDGVEPEAAAKASRDMADSAISKLAEMAKAPEDFGGATAIKHTLTVATKISTKLDEAIATGDVAEQFGLMDDLKRAIGKPAKGAARLDPRGAADELVASQNTARAAGLSDLYHSLRDGLEDESVWKKAAVDQKEINKAWTTHIDASSRFHKAMTTEGPRPEGSGFDTPPRIVDPAKIDSYVKNLTNANQDLTHKAVIDYVDSSKKIAETISQAYELPANKLAAVKRVGDSAKGFASTLEKTTKNLQLVNQFDAVRNKTGGAASKFFEHADTIGALLGGAPGAALGRTIGSIGGMLTRPADAIMHLARFEGMVRRSDSRILRGARAFFAGNKGAPSALPLDSFEKYSSKVKDLMGDPAELQHRIQANVGALGQHSPGVAAAMTATSVAGLSLLQSKLPQQPDSDPLNPDAKMPTPPPAQREAWLRYYRAVKEPLSVVHDLQSGRLSPEGVDVLKTVYPPLYAKVQKTFFDELSSGKGKDMSVQQRAGLSLLLDLPTPTSSPEYIRERQAAYTTPPPDDGSGGGGSPSKRSKPVNLQITSSPVDRVENASKGNAS
jgi:hypothetical protein